MKELKKNAKTSSSDRDFTRQWITNDLIIGISHGVNDQYNT